MINCIFFLFLIYVGAQPALINSDNVQISFNQKLEEVAKNASEEIKQAIDFNNKGIIEMFKDIWQSNKVFNKRLNQHDIEIKKLKAKFN